MSKNYLENKHVNIHVPLPISYFTAHLSNVLKLSPSFHTSEACYVENINEIVFGTNTKSTNVRIHELLLFNQTTKIDTQKEKYFHSILEYSNFVASTLIYKHLSVAHADSNWFFFVIFNTWLRFFPVKCELKIFWLTDILHYNCVNCFEKSMSPPVRTEEYNTS